jgi:hypothetical protein
MKATKDFEELLAAFLRSEVRFLIVGAHALAWHAKPRYTKDLDLFLEADSSNAERAVAALEQFGFAGLGISASDLESPGSILQLGVPPTRVDLITRIDGVTFEEAWQSRVTGRYGLLEVPYIGFEALVRNKAASARPQDLADLQTLRRFRRE